MSVVVYDQANFSGNSTTLDVGDYTREYFRNQIEGFDGTVTSLRVGRNTIVLLSQNSSPTGSGNNRVIIGPIELTDLSSINFSSVGSMKVQRFREDNWGGDASAAIFNNYNFTGGFKNLRAGEYDATRISSKENNRSGIADGNIKSITVGNNTILILYDGPNFETTLQAVYVEGPMEIGDLSVYNLDGKLSSIKVFSIDKAPHITNNPVHGPPSPEARSNGYKGLGHISDNPIPSIAKKGPVVVKATIHHPDSSILVLVFIIALITILLTGSTLALNFPVQEKTQLSRLQ